MPYRPRVRPKILFEKCANHREYHAEQLVTASMSYKIGKHAKYGENMKKAKREKILE